MVWLRIWLMIIQYRKTSAFTHIEVRQQKIAALEKYPEKELKTVVLQDRTNSILKQKHRDMNDLFNEYIELVEVVSNNFKLKSLVLMDILPIKWSNHNLEFMRTLLIIWIWNYYPFTKWYETTKLPHLNYLFWFKASSWIASRENLS